MKIDELVKATGIPTGKIRQYERTHLLPRPENPAHPYHYPDAAVDRLVFIERCMAMEMPLHGIRALLRCWDSPHENAEQGDRIIIDRIDGVAVELEQLAKRHERLKNLNRQLSELRIELQSAAGERNAK